MKTMNTTERRSGNERWQQLMAGKCNKKKIVANLRKYYKSPEWCLAQ